MRSVLSLSVLLVVMTASVAIAADGAEERTVVTIEMKGRQFVPALARLGVHRPVELVLVNQDAELHAFVPIGLLDGQSVSVGGNGAPDFGDTGFRKVIVPSGGRAILRFVPDAPGDFAFFCDMPGHDMRGILRVERE